MPFIFPPLNNDGPNKLAMFPTRSLPVKNPGALNVFSLLHQGPKGLNQPEAHSLYRESCLNTSVSALKKKGISIISLPDLDSVRYFNQKPFHRYWLATDTDRQRAVNLLNHYRQKRGLGKLEFAPWHDNDKKSA